MIDFAKNGYTHRQMQEILTSNRQVKYEFELLDKNNIAICEVNAEGTINFNADCICMRTAMLTINDVKDIDFVNARIKPYMCVKAPGEYVRYPLGVFLVASPSVENDGILSTRPIDCYDFTQILIEDKFTNRYVVAKNTIYTVAVASILESANIYDFDIDSSDLTLGSDIEFEIGTSKIDAINTLLKAINYVPLWFDENGKARSSTYVKPKNRTEEYNYVTDKNSVILTGCEELLDTFNVPNKIVRYTDNPEQSFLRAEWVNDNVSSRLSTVSRGRTIVDIESVMDIANQDTLQQYVDRIATEKSLFEQIKFGTANMPCHAYQNCLRVDIPNLNISSTYIEQEWTMELKIGGKMTHRCRKLVSI